MEAFVGYSTSEKKLTKSQSKSKSRSGGQEIEFYVIETWDRKYFLANFHKIGTFLSRGHKYLGQMIKMCLISFFYHLTIESN